MSRRISFAKDSITRDNDPTRPEYRYMAGFNSSPSTQRLVDDESSNCFADPTGLFVRCLVIWDGPYPNVIVSADVLGFPRTMHRRIREKVIKLWEFGRKWDFVLTATHTHNGPVLVDSPSPWIMYGIEDLAPVQRYSDWLEDRIVDVVQTALYATPIDCTLEYAVGTANFAVQRRTASWTETDVPVLVARPVGPHPKPVLAILFSYGCHPLSIVARCWDGDFPTRTCIDLEKDACDFALFVQGPGGDQDADPTKLPDYSVGDPFAKNPPRFAKLLSDAVRAVMGSGRAIRGSIQSAYREVDLPLDVPVASRIGELRDAYREPNDLVRSTYQGSYGRHFDEMVRRIDTKTYEATVSLPVLVWHFIPQHDPPLRIVFVGGELVAGYAAELRKHCGGAGRVFVVGYANEVPCYVPSNELLPPVKPGSTSCYEGGFTVGKEEIATESQVFYGQIGHFVGPRSAWGRPSSEGIEAVLFPALCEMVDTLPT